MPSIEPCRTVVKVAESPSKDPRQTGQERVDRRFATRLVRISGRNLDDDYISDQIISLMVEETARGLSKAEIVINNPDGRLTDNELFQYGVKVEVYTGYRSKPFVKRGTFYCAKPVFSFVAGSPKIELNCYGEEWLLSVNEIRQTYENRRDSEIATLIADRYGLKADVDRTEPIHEHVAQVNVTDAVFLEERSRLHGFDFYIEEGVLHFHAPRFVDSGLSLFYGVNQVATIAAFRVSVDPWMSGMRWTRSGIDRLTGKEWTATSQDEQDAVAREIKSRSASKFKRAGEIAALKGLRPQRFIVGGGHEQTEAEGRDQVQGYTRATEWIVHGLGSVIGVETLKARQVIEIVGVGHHAGFYYVTRVMHHQKGGYTMNFDAVRPGTGALLASPGARVGTGAGRTVPDDVTSKSPVIGTAQMTE